jgi:benzoyl-CoA reductase/2-hydroxyglutaryl-CoA dehydratase subunit BcrC/BadD/HgdB
MSTSAIAELTAGFEEPFGALGRDAGRDRDAVVISWPSVPVEIVRAAGLRAVVARGSAAPTPAADAALEPELFPNRLHHLVEAALTGRLAKVAAIVLPRTSDPDYKCFLYLRELERRGAAAALPPVLLFDLLHSAGDEVAAYDAARARDLLDRLAELAGRRPRPNDLRLAIDAANAARAAARRLDALRRPQPRLGGAAALPLLGAIWQIAPQRYAALANAAADGLAARAPLTGPRVLLAGTPADSAALHAALESAGAIVVAEASPFGAAAAGRDVDAAADPFAALAARYRASGFDARTPVAAALRFVEDLLTSVDAVVISLPPDDASFGWDYPRLRQLLEQRALPHVVLEHEPAGELPPVERGRVEALLGGAAARRRARHG